MSGTFTRRSFLKSSIYGAALTSFATGPVFGQTTLKQRLDWDTFKQTRDYASFVNGIAKMRANTNASDKRSWQYWVNVHVNNCPHNISYFMAWHRGYLNLFEQQLRAVSGNPNLTLPYWDYYKSPVIPAEFTNPASWNPLYQQRSNTDVRQALTMAPFANTVTNFPRGTTSAYEALFEDNPHNPVHNLIGGIMATMQSPTDPIFWLHHANVDRLWSAWVAAGGGRTMPALSNSYWSGNFTYAPSLTMARNLTYDTRTNLNYFYQNESMPSSLPAAAMNDEPIMLAMADSVASLGIGYAANVVSLAAPKRPAKISVARTPKRSTGNGRLSLGGIAQFGLNETSVSADVPIDTDSSQILRMIFQRAKASPFGLSSPAASAYSSVQVVLDNVSIAGNGAAGGYFYKIFLNLPENGNSGDSEDQYLLGTVGPFQLSAASHHGAARLVFPATGVMDRIKASELNQLSVSFVRISGGTSPSGEVITVGECRIEVSNDDIE